MNQQTVVTCPSKINEALFSANNSEIQVSSDLYRYMHDVLLPKSFGHNYFVFQEGYGDIYHFRKVVDDYYCRAVYMGVCDNNFKVHVDLYFEDGGEIRVNRSWFADHADESDSLRYECKLDDILSSGHSFKTVKDIEEYLDITFRR